jgi:hypothetical protein
MAMRARLVATAAAPPVERLRRHLIRAARPFSSRTHGAQAYYEQAIEAFKKAKTPLIERVLSGDANKRRIDFVKERLVDITWGRKPDGDKYLDENGQKRPVPAGLAPPEDYPQDETHLSEEWRSGEPRMPAWASGEGDGYGGGGGGYRGDDGYRGDGPDAAHDGRDEHQQGGYTISQSSYSEPPPASHMAGAGGGGRAVGAQQEAAAAGPVDEEQEAARKEWLQYHMEMGEWDQAAELVVTREEKEDLDYLMQRAKRVGSTGAVGGSGSSGPVGRSGAAKAPPAAATTFEVAKGAAVGNLLGGDDDEDQML